MNASSISRHVIASLMVGMITPAYGTVGTLPYLTFSSFDGSTFSADFCDDNDPCDSNSAAGTIVWSGNLADFSFTLTGLSNQAGSTLMDLSWVITRPFSITGSRDVMIGFADEGFSGGGKVAGAISGSLDAGWTLTSADAYQDTTLLGSLGPFSGPGGFFGSFDPPVPPTTFSLDQLVSFTVGSPGTATMSSGDFALSTPEPGTLALLSLGLAGLAATRRRRQRVVPVITV